MEVKMKEEIEKVAEEISGPVKGMVVSELTSYALKIGEAALVSFRGQLRERALDIAKNIVDYEDELNKQS